MIILCVLNLEGFSEQNILFSVVIFDKKKTTQKLLRLVLIHVLERHMNGQMDRMCNDTNSDKAYYLLVVYEWLFSVTIA